MAASDWAPLIGAIGASTIGVISTITGRAQPPRSVLDAAVGGDVSTLQSNQGTSLALILLGGFALYMVFAGGRRG